MWKELLLVVMFSFLGTILNYAIFAHIVDVWYDKWIDGTIIDLGITRVAICVLMVIPGALTLAVMAYALLLTMIEAVKELVAFVRRN